MRHGVGWRGLLRAGVVLVVVGLMGCSTSDRPPISQLQQGLNLLDVRDPSWGMNAAYVKNNRVIYIETRIGALKPDVYRKAWPSDPPNETDLRFVDQNGHTFFAQRGGDNFIDPTWAKDFTDSVKAGAQVKPADREMDFEMAKEASQAIALKAPVGFQNHVFYLKKFAAHAIPSQDPAMIAKAQTLAKAITQPAPYGGWGSSGATWLETDLYAGSTGCFAWICTAEHSATMMWYSFDGWNSYGEAMAACNHGRCPWDDGMGYNCYSSGGPFYYGASINGETCSEHDCGTDITGACQTSYNWDSGGWDHLCNDDSAFELWQSKTGSAGNWELDPYGNGYDFEWYANANYACTCSNTGCDGDWSAPYCP